MDDDRYKSHEHNHIQFDRIRAMRKDQIQVHDEFSDEQMARPLLVSTLVADDIDDPYQYERLAPS